jgi:hypothetical protein
MHEGVEQAVVDPRVVGPEVADRYFTTKERRVQRMYGVRDSLVLRRSEVATVVEKQR